MKNSGLFLNMAKGVLLGLFFEVLMLLWLVFGMSGIVPKVLNMLVFPKFWGFCGVASSCLFVFGMFGCFWVLVFGFLFGVGFVSVCLLCFVLWLDAVVSVSVFVCLFIF